jgi:hypothetical protein
MRRGTLLVVGLLVASIAMPQTADARPRLLGALMGVIGAPFGAIFGGHRYARSRAAHHRRAVAARARPAATAAATAAAGATAATAAGTATSAPAPATAATQLAAPEAADAQAAPKAADAQAAAPNTIGLAPSQDAGVQETTAKTAQGTAEDATPVPLPNPAPPQRTAALPPGEEPRANTSAPARTPRSSQGRLGTVGPVAWPNAYEDVIGFTLWPKEYGERLGVHGIGDVLSTAFAPGPSVTAATRQARAGEPGGGPVATTCGSIDLTSADWPVAQISSTIELDEAQRAALGKLKIALSDAVASIKSNCPDDTNLAPVARLRVMQTALWAVHDAAQLIRAPLAAFYDSLDESQKQKFAAPAQPSAGAHTMSRADMARMCDLPASTDVAIRQIEQSVRPTKAQRTSLEALQKKWFEMGQFLMASCLKPMPATPAERLDAAADRLTAVIFAASNVNMALSDFTSQLSDEQTTKLNSMVR